MKYAKKVPAMAQVVGFPYPAIRVLVSEARDGLVWCKIADERVRVRTAMVLEIGRVSFE